MDSQMLTSRRPYLLRAMREWLVDNALTPYLAVDASYPGVKVPVEHVKDGHIVLNISSEATHNLVIGNERVEFSARFNGVQRFISLPVGSVLGIYAREAGQGMMFPEREETVAPGEAGAATDSGADRAERPKGSHLTLVKKD